VVLWDALTGRMVRKFEGLGKGHGGGVQAVSFSADGKKAATLERAGRVRIWDVAEGRETGAFRTAQYMDFLLFSGDGTRLLVGDRSGPLMLRDLERGRFVKKWKYGQWRCAALSPDGRTVATAKGREQGITLWDMERGGKKILSGGIKGTPEEMAFSPDGKRLAAFFRKSGVMLFDLPTGRRLRTFKTKAASVSNLAFAPDGRQILYASESVNVLDTATGRVSVPVPRPPQRRYSGKASGPIGSFYGPTPGSRRSRSRGDTVTCRASSPDGRFTMVATRNKRMRLWVPSKRGSLRTLKGHAGIINAATFIPKKNWLVSGSEDGTVRLWDPGTGREIAQFTAFPNKEWIVSTPEGYFMSSLHGHDFLNVRSGSGLLPINQFYDVFYRPDLVKKKLQGEDISGLTNRFTIRDALRNPPPEVSIVSTEKDEKAPERGVKLRVRIQDRGGRIGDIRVYHNGKLVHSRGFYRVARLDQDPGRSGGAGMSAGNPYRIAHRGISLVSGGMEKKGRVGSMREVTPLIGDVTETYEVGLIGGRNTLSVAAFNGTNTIMSSMETMEVVSEVQKKKPRLFALVAGNNRFRDSRLNLEYAVKDATDFASLLKKRAGAVFDKVFVRLLTDAKKEDLVKEFNEMAGAMGQEDVFVFFAASYGKAEDDLYYVFTSDFDGTGMRRASISSVELMEFSKRVPALKQIYILDTCQSGQVGAIVSGLYDARISVLAKALGMHILAGAKTSQSAVDRYKDNGLFTHFVLRGLEGAADEDRDRTIRILEMTPFLKASVKEASGGLQETYIRNFGTDFPVAAGGISGRLKENEEDSAKTPPPSRMPGE